MAELQQLIIGAVGTTLVIATLLFGVSKLNYRIDDRYVRVLLGPIPLRKVAIEDIRDARMTCLLYLRPRPGWSARRA